MSRFPQAPLTAEGISAMATVAREQGADRMRRRIRAKQREALRVICQVFDRTDSVILHDALLKAYEQLDAATRSAPRKGRGR